VTLASHDAPGRIGADREGCKGISLQERDFYIILLILTQMHGVAVASVTAGEESAR